VSGKISGLNSSPPPAAPATSAAGQRAAAASSPAAGGTNTTDSVQITDTASHLVTAEQALADVPVISQGRVTQISNLLAAGTYKVSPERIANKLLQFERLLPDDPADPTDPSDAADSAE
jgi:negative regulator of flagellin synthesis FlgM